MNQATPVIRIIILEDAANVRNALVALFDGTPGFACVGAYDTAQLALRGVARERPRVALVDLELPGSSGTEFVRQCRRQYPELGLLVLTVHDGARWVFPALEAGAVGYVVKGTPPARLIEAVAEVSEGRSFMSRTVARLVLDRMHRQAGSAADLRELTPRERELLTLLAKGLTYVEIANQLGIAPRTVNSHVTHIYEKLHVHSAAGAVGRLLDSQLDQAR